MEDYERLGAFYLGRRYDPDARTPTPELILYDSKDLSTHAVLMGMTGSGKTGLGIALIEEAAIDGIPVIAIDPKGDLANLALTFPRLLPEDFEPWVDSGEATRDGATVSEYAAKVARRWRDGLAEWGQGADRIERLRSAAEVEIFTPGSAAGTPVCALRSFSAPPRNVLADPDALRERIASAASSLLALIGIDADPIRSREHILISKVLEHSWGAGRSLGMADLIREVQSPPFERVGVFDVESFYPSRDRTGLAMELNNLLASPGFAAWMDGVPLELPRFLRTESGKPKISVFSIAHLSEAERMFFVTLLLNEVLAWMRTQSGTGSLRAIVYMDEVFGYFPPVKNPPSKTPMLTLLKQARAFGVGMVLATQNPVDLDYKGLANAGSWFIGRMQTQRDMDRVLEGLEGASAAAGAHFDRAQFERWIAGLGKRVFLLNNVHDDAPVLMQTRWVLSYLRGPLTRDHIQRLSVHRPAESPVRTAPPPTVAPPSGSSSVTGSSPRATDEPSQPLLPPEVPQRFVPAHRSPRAGEHRYFRPSLLGTAKVHYVSAKNDVDHWETVTWGAAVDPERESAPWDEAVRLAERPDLESEALESGSYGALPSWITGAKRFGRLGREFAQHVYQNQRLTIFAAEGTPLVSSVDETEADFRMRLRQELRERRDAEIEKLRGKFAPKLARLEERIRRAEDKVEKEREQYEEKRTGSMISFGVTVLGALFGRKLASAGNVGRAASSARSVTRAAREKADIARAEESLEVLQEDRDQLQKEFDGQVEAIQLEIDPQTVELETVEITPRKGDIDVEEVLLVWEPWRVDPRGVLQPDV
ncbi:MAG: ATP-binding protein [Planctomycetes bacterium]|nr:ATP-binding protein [Planctomycetota bacterium]